MKRTRKYLAALETSNGAKHARKAKTQEEFYQLLQKEGLAWNAAAGEWQDAPKPSDAPAGVPGLVRIRVSANADEAGDVTDWLIHGAKSAGAKVLEVSEPYPNTRKGTGVRIYIALDMDGVFEEDAK